MVDRLLRRGSMFVFSTNQIRKLLNVTYFASGSTLIDLGAGDGATTEKYTPLVNHIYVTEKSGPMIRILAQKGFRLALLMAQRPTESLSYINRRQSYYTSVTRSLTNKWRFLLNLDCWTLTRGGLTARNST